MINPGTINCGDQNGIVVVRQEVAEALLKRLQLQRDSAAGYEDNVRNGVFSNEWVDVALEEAGCVFYDTLRLGKIGQQECSIRALHHGSRH